MYRYELAAVIRSEAILGSGISNVYIHEDCLHDEEGFLYYHSKTLKGLLHKIGEKLLGSENENVKAFFGDIIKEGQLMFSNLEIPEEIKNQIRKEHFSVNEVLNLQTNIRQFIEIGDGNVTKKGSLRNIRLAKDGLVFIGEIRSVEELTDEQKKDLLFILKATRNIGMMKNRGRGEIEFKIDYEADLRG